MDHQAAYQLPVTHRGKEIGINEIFRFWIQSQVHTYDVSVSGNVHGLRSIFNSHLLSAFRS